MNKTDFPAASERELITPSRRHLERVVSWRTASLLYIFVWSISGAATVHQKMKVHDGIEEYGWGPCILLTLILINMAALAYQWGKHAAATPPANQQIGGNQK